MTLFLVYTEGTREGESKSIVTRDNEKYSVHSERLSPFQGSDRIPSRGISDRGGAESALVSQWKAECLLI